MCAANAMLTENVLAQSSFSAFGWSSLLHDGKPITDSHWFFSIPFKIGLKKTSSMVFKKIHEA